MRILTVHNRYKFRGGEDESREAEDKLLMERGHAVIQLVFDNSSISHWNALRVGIEATWSTYSYKTVQQFIREWSPDIVDVHNFFPLVSPAVYYAAQKLGVPVVQTLHNYRLLCPGANFYRKGAVCEDCTKHATPWPGILHRCYRGSASQTTAVALMISIHRRLRTWGTAVDAFIAVSEFAKEKFVAGGFPEQKIFVKPNFLFDPGLLQMSDREGFAFVGRLSPEKGVGTLLKAIAMVPGPARFSIAGDGPLKAIVTNAALKDPRIRYLGRIPQLEAIELMRRSEFVIVPSECYETFGRAAAEAFSVGTPVICARIGALTEMVDPGKTGIMFDAASAEDLARAIIECLREPDRSRAMSGHARARYEERYTPERNYVMLTDIYESVRAEKQILPAA